MVERGSPPVVWDAEESYPASSTRCLLNRAPTCTHRLVSRPSSRADGRGQGDPYPPAGLQTAFNAASTAPDRRCNLPLFRRGVAGRARISCFDEKSSSRRRRPSICRQDMILGLYHLRPCASSRDAPGNGRGSRRCRWRHFGATPSGWHLQGAGTGSGSRASRPSDQRAPRSGFAGLLGAGQQNARPDDAGPLPVSTDSLPPTNFFSHYEVTQKELGPIVNALAERYPKVAVGRTPRQPVRRPASTGPTRCIPSAPSTTSSLARVQPPSSNRYERRGEESRRQ